MLKEFYAITESLKKWWHYLQDHKFQIVTDHHSLTHILTQPNLTPQQVRAIELLVEYDYEIIYQEEEKNIVTDVLSH
jgi:RNase H-like domain found in reverse transcriptase